MKNVRVNILNAVNADTIRIERKGDFAIIRNYRWHIDDVVLNGGLYPKEENEKGYMSMNGRLAPAGHPKDDSNYVAISNLSNESATKALADHYIGARTVNVNKQGSFYFGDIEVNTRIANASDKGKEVVKWIDSAEAYLAGNGEKPSNLHTSTGLNTIRVNAEGESRGKQYTWIATNQQYDHLALLPGEVGAGGDELSLSVNEEGEEVMVINCDITGELETNEIETNEPLERGILNALKKLLKFNTGESSDSDNVNWEERVMNKFLEALNAAGIKTEGMNEAQVFDAYNEYMKEKAKKESESDDQDDEEENMKDKKDKKDKKGEMKGNAEEVPAWAQGLLDKVNSLESTLAANADKEKAPVIAKVLAANKAFTEEQLKGFTIEQLNSLLPQQPFGAVVTGGEHLTGNAKLLGDDYSFGGKES